MLAAAIASLFAGHAAHAQQNTSTEDNQATVVVTGTRVSNRTVLDTTAPVDVISADMIKNTGVPEITQALSVALPSPRCSPPPPPRRRSRIPPPLKTRPPSS